MDLCPASPMNKSELALSLIFLSLFFLFFLFFLYLFFSLSHITLYNSLYHYQTFILLPEPSIIPGPQVK